MGSCYCKTCDAVEEQKQINLQSDPDGMNDDFKDQALNIKIPDNFIKSPGKLTHFQLTETLSCNEFQLFYYPSPIINKNSQRKKIVFSFNPLENDQNQLDFAFQLQPIEFDEEYYQKRVQQIIKIQRFWKKFQDKRIHKCLQNISQKAKLKSLCSFEEANQDKMCQTYLTQESNLQPLDNFHSFIQSQGISQDQFLFLTERKQTKTNYQSQQSDRTCFSSSLYTQKNSLKEDRNLFFEEKTKEKKIPRHLNIKSL